MKFDEKPKFISHDRIGLHGGETIFFVRKSDLKLIKEFEGKTRYNINEYEIFTSEKNAYKYIELEKELKFSDEDILEFVKNNTSIVKALLRRYTKYGLVNIINDTDFIRSCPTYTEDEMWSFANYYQNSEGLYELNILKYWKELNNKL